MKLRLSLIFVILLLLSASVFAYSYEKEKSHHNYDHDSNIHEVVLRANKFGPHELVVNVGDKVVWTNQDQVPHTFESGFCASQKLGPGMTYSHTFYKKGTHYYESKTHNSMRGIVHVI